MGYYFQPQLRTYKPSPRMEGWEKCSVRILFGLRRKRLIEVINEFAIKNNWDYSECLNIEPNGIDPLVQSLLFGIIPKIIETIQFDSDGREFSIIFEEVEISVWLGPFDGDSDEICLYFEPKHWKHYETTVKAAKKIFDVLNTARQEIY